LSRRSSNADPLKSQLIQFKIKGGFPSPVHEAFRRDPALLREVATTLLRSNFPPSLHDDILAAVGLNFESVSPRLRLSSFRSEVLATYGHACAFCGLSVRLGSADLALDAAHIMWHQASGPDIPSNGLACCSLHHRALDRGAISLNDDLSILVSTSLHGGSRLDELFLSLAGKPLRLPGRRADAPGRDFLLWHRSQVFHPPPRDA
jgi:putative restriction endonuclease